MNNYKSIIFKLTIKDNENAQEINDINGEPLTIVHITENNRLFYKEIKEIMKKNNLMNENDDILFENKPIKYLVIDKDLNINLTILKNQKINNNLNIIDKINLKSVLKKNNIVIGILLLIFFALPILMITFSDSLILNLIIIWIISLIGFILFIISMIYYESTSHIEKDNKRLSEINNMKSLFLANMSHELKTPLSNVIGLSELILTKKNNIITKEEYNFVKDIKLSAESIYTLVNDILLFSKSVSGHIELEVLQFDLDSLLLSIISLITIKLKEKNINLKINNMIVSLYSFPYLLKGDPNKIKHILLNLLTNAIKFSHNNSNIDIIVEYKT